MKPNKIVIFDLDGTLLDTLEDLCDAVNYILKRYGCPARSMEEVRAFVGNGAEMLMRRAVPADFDMSLFAVCLQEYVDYYEAHSQIKTKPYPGVLEMLQMLKAAGVKTAVTSNKPDGAVKLLSKRYFGDLIDAALGDREGIARKPSPEPCCLVMKELGCTEAVFVGDSEVDVATAKNAGIPEISMTWGFRDRDCLVEAGAPYLADNAAQLEGLLVSLLELSPAEDIKNDPIGI